MLRRNYERYVLPKQRGVIDVVANSLAPQRRELFLLRVRRLLQQSGLHWNQAVHAAIAQVLREAAA